MLFAVLLYLSEADLLAAAAGCCWLLLAAACWLLITGY
jgi:hypothetical protein